MKYYNLAMKIINAGSSLHIQSISLSLSLNDSFEIQKAKSDLISFTVIAAMLARASTQLWSPVKHAREADLGNCKLQGVCGRVTVRSEPEYNHTCLHPRRYVLQVLTFDMPQPGCTGGFRRVPESLFSTLLVFEAASISKLSLLLSV